MLDNIFAAVGGALQDGAADATHRERLKTDLDYFARHALKLRPKMGPLEPFVFNPAQQELHRIVQKQRDRTGRVRIVILKSRQLGISTYIAARLFHRTIYSPGRPAMLIVHTKPALPQLD